METSRGNNINTYQIWEKFSSSFAVVLPDNLVDLPLIEKKNCLRILDEIFKTYKEHCKHLIPEGKYCETTLTLYICFDSWLFGQFIRVYLNEHYENRTDPCLEVQLVLLKFIAQSNPYIFNSLINSYLKMLQYLCDVASQESTISDTGFIWFKSPGNIPISLNEVTIKIQNSEFAKPANLILKILLAHVTSVCDMCAASLDLLWRCCTKLMAFNDIDKLLCYPLLSSLIEEDGLPNHEFEFNPAISELLLHIMNDVGRICQAGKIPEEPSFCALLNIMSEYLRSDTCYDYLYVNSLYCLIFQCQVSLNEPTENAILKFYMKLLGLSSNEIDIMNLSAESNLQPVNISLFAITLRFSIEKQIEQMPNNSNVEIYQSNKHWKSLIDQTNKYIQDVEKKTTAALIKQSVTLFKAVQHITRSAIYISYRFKLNFSFFGGEIYTMIKGLVKIAERHINKTIYQLLIRIVGDCLILPEIQDDDSNDKMLLLALLTLPVRSFILGSHLPANLHDQLWEVVDDEIKINSVTSLMYIRFLSSDFKCLLLQESFASDIRKVFECLPVLIHHLTDEELQYFQNNLINADARILTELSSSMEKIVCALDGHCFLTKLPDTEDIELLCKVCDTKDSSESATLPVSEYRRSVINRLISSIMSATDEAKLNMLSCAIRISNHICETNFRDFLLLLYDCFTNEQAEIRVKMVQITPNILFKNIIDSPSRLEYSGTVLNHDQFANYIKSLQALLVRAVITGDSKMQYTCIKCIGKIGLIPIEMTLFPSISLLMNAWILAPSKSSPLARSTIEQIIRAHDQDERNVYLKYQDNLFPLITHLIVMNTWNYNVSLYDSCIDYSILFCSDTLPHILKYLLPLVVQHSHAEKVINELVEVCDASVDKILLKSFPHIFVHVMLSQEPNEANKIFELIQNKTRKKIGDLLKDCVTKVLADLLIHFENERIKVGRSVLIVRKILNGSSWQDIGVPSQEDNTIIASFVRARFFGILMFLETQLESASVLKKTRRQIISSLTHIIELMESEYITKVRFKVLFALRTITSSEKSKYSVQCVQLWSTFIRLIDKDVLGPMLSTFFVSLWPLAEQQGPLVNDILRYLIIENRAVVQPHLCELYFVTSDQYDRDISRAIDSGKQLINMALEEKLSLLTKLIQHEIVEVKLHALNRLKDELFNHHKEISQLILASDSMNYLIPEIHRVLFEGFRNADEEIQKASGMCLGEFGAIDPSYIPNTMIKDDDVKKYTFYPIDETQFVVDALKVLSKGFQTVKTKFMMDTFAMAIQQTLKSCKVTESNECKHWRQIPETLREIIQPFFTTNYKLELHNSEMSNNISHLFYSNQETTTVVKWVYNWSSFLISLLESDTDEKNYFYYVKGVISYDYDGMLFFLPYILLKAVLSAKTQRDVEKIYEEMISIIRDDRRPHSRPPNKEYSSTQLVVTEELSVMRNVGEQGMDVICTKTVFHLLDTLNKKYRDMRATCRGTPSAECKRLTSFLEKFSPGQMVEKSFERKEYARSLLYIEDHLSQHEATANFIDKYLPLLAEIYVHLNDVDNVKGLFARHSIKLRQPQHVIMLHEITDQFQDAAICYQQLLKDTDEERSMVYEKRMIRGYLSMNQPEMALRFAESPSAVLGRKNSSYFYDDVKCEALWNLSQYEDLARVTSSKNAQQNDAWGVRIGQAIVHFLNNRPDLLGDELTRIRKTLTNSLHLCSAGYGAYKECYEFAIKFHILNEFEKVSDHVFKTLSASLPVDQCRTTFESLFKIEFEERLNKLQPISRVLQPVLNIRQTLFSVARQLSAEKPELVAMFNEEIRKCWLKAVEIANRTRNFQLAYSNILAIENYQLKGFFIEKAKYYWEKMEQREALRTLLDGIAYHYPNLEVMIQHRSVDNAADREICAEAMLLIGTYNDTMVNTDLDTNLKYFQNAAKLNPINEKILVKLAQYYDKIARSVPAEDLYRCNSDLHVKTMKFYGHSLIYSCEFIYQSLSRLINVWLDYATILNQDNKNKRAKKEQLDAFAEMNKNLQQFIARLPTYYFCTAFSLIMSRISHPEQHCFEILHKIIVNCLEAYPNQMLWQFMSLHRSKNRVLQERCRKILGSQQLNKMTPFIFKFQQLFEQFSALCLASRSSSNNACGATSLKNLIRRTPLPLLNGNAQFENDILIPAQKFLTIVLPRSQTSETSYNPYPETMVFINRIRDEVHIYSSLQKPIRVTLLGTDGNEYVMIFKAYDDMRIDCRCVEFNSVVNTYLKRDVEARDRALRIRTYTVLPLLENTGIIEFIPQLISMRGVNMQMRRAFGYTSVSIKSHECNLSDSLQKKLETYRKLVKMHPPLLHEWFKQEFPNPTSWYAARTSYIRSLAVMSIVGYTLGLGDRHNDNILLDSNSGDVIHVDLNVIFNKGELLQWPEMVPFRLTHSMIKAMGPLGYEGSFVCTSEIVNRILRERKEQLVSILHMFLYDAPSASSNHKDKEGYGPESSIQKVESRLSGCVTGFKRKPYTSIPLSVEGQTRKLIEVATDEENLCQMFIGWSAFI